MAPEQARGKAVDQRADIWAFGAVLFEMVTGQRAFAGTEVTDVLAAILKTDPDWSLLPADVPPSIRRLLRRCLEKDPARRLSAIADARLELDEVDTPPAAPVPAPHAGPRRSWAALILTAALAAIATAVALTSLRSAPRTTSAPDVARMSMLPPPGSELYPDSANVAISPDGTMVAFVVGGFGEREGLQLWVRRLDSLTATRLEGGDGAILPFWKPDGTRIGFFSGLKLKTIAVTGGRAQDLADATPGRGGTWNQNDVILFAGDSSGTLSRVSASGGEVTRITTLDPARKEGGHRFPVFLPDGDHFLYAALPGRDGKFNIFAGALSDPKLVSLVVTAPSAPVYAPSTSSGQSGWLLFGRQGVLVAQAFDPKTLKTTGQPVPLVDEPSVLFDPSRSYTAGRITSVSSTGALAYYSGPIMKTHPVWLDSTGQTTGTLPVKPGYYSTVRVSPDATQAVFVQSTSPTESTMWLIDLQRASASLLASGGGRNDTPVWSADGTRVLFASDREGPQNFYVKNLVDGTPERPIYQSDVLFKNPTDWLRDGSVLFNQILPGAGYDIYSLPATGNQVPVLAVGGRLRELGGRLSPNGQWLGFVAEDTGGLELYLQAFGRPGRRIQVSSNGATMGWWTPDSRRIVYATSDMRELWRVDVEPAGSDLRIGAPVRMGTLPAGLVAGAIDATPDRQRFLALVPEQIGAPSLTVVQHFERAIEKR
jgi:Tol biopolymer transport system component